MRHHLDRWFPWLAGAVLVAGIATFLVTRYTGSTTQAPPPHATAPLTAAERRLASAFVDTAVARRHLARAWDIVAPELKEGMSLDEWKTGTIPVVPYPVDQARVLMHVVDSFTDTARLQITFVPRSGAQAKAASFALGLRKVDGRWLVSSWQPSSAVGPRAGK